jgi:hypothetical protein
MGNGQLKWLKKCRRHIGIKMLPSMNNSGLYLLPIQMTQTMKKRKQLDELGPVAHNKVDPFYFIHGLKV